MPTFSYTGLTANGAETSGEIAAQSRSEAAALLHKQRIRPVSIRSQALNLDFSARMPVNTKDLARFTRDFATMASSGIPLTQCVEILAEQTEHKGLARAIRQVSADVLGGSGLAEALEKHSRFFKPLYCSLVAAGEASGKLDVVLQRLAQHLEKANSLRNKIIGAMVYPAVIAAVTVAATILMFTVVVPQFASMFRDLGGTLPLPTRIIIDMSSFAQGYGLWILAGAMIAIFAVLRFVKTERGALILDTIKLRLPLIGTLQSKSAIARFSQTLSTLLASGVSILNALNIAASTAGNKVLEKGLLLTLEKIAGGQSVYEPLRDTGLFPPMVIRMVAVGEKTGDLAGMLNKISLSYEEEVDTAVHAITSVLEPIMLVVMALIIGGILVAMYLPMFEMMTTIQ